MKTHFKCQTCRLRKITVKLKPTKLYTWLVDLNHENIETRLRENSASKLERNGQLLSQ